MLEVTLSKCEVGAGISCQRKQNGGIDISVTKHGKTWTVVRSEEEINNLHSSFTTKHPASLSNSFKLEKEFSGLLTVPALPSVSASPTEPLDSLQAYLSNLVNHPSIKTSDFLKKFVDIKEDLKGVAAKSSKKGPLKLKEGKNKKYDVTVENRVLYCIGQSSGVCEVAVLLDNCQCEPSSDEECGFSVNSKSRETNQSKRRTVLGKISQNGSPHYFIAGSRAERDEWVEVINAASQVVVESSFAVTGRLTVEVEGKSLAPKDFHLLSANTSDPYVLLLIDRQQARSRTINRNLNPMWNEEFSFSITLRSQALAKYIYFSDISQNQAILFVLLYDEDIISRNDSMGQVVVALSGLTPGVLQDMWLPVLPRKAHEKISGQVRLRIKYTFAKEDASVVVGPVFGANLQEICDNPHLSENGVPKFFSKFLSYLEAHAMDEQGIFRISGSFSLVKEIKQKIDQGKEVLLESYDVHCIAGALKLYMRELPVPLLTYENYTKLIEVTNISNEKEMMQQIKMILAVIPPAHIDLLKLLLPSLKRFSQSSKVNMMTTSNLAIVFGPSLIRPQVDNFETVLHTVNISQLTTLLIEHNINWFQ